MRISDWSSDVCSSDLCRTQRRGLGGGRIGIKLCNRDVKPRVRLCRQQMGAVWTFGHDLGPVYRGGRAHLAGEAMQRRHRKTAAHAEAERADAIRVRRGDRSEEHTSELQSLMRSSYDVFCLKKKNNGRATI